MVSHLDFVWIYGLKVFVLDNLGKDLMKRMALAVYNPCISRAELQELCLRWLGVFITCMN